MAVRYSTKLPVSHASLTCTSGASLSFEWIFIVHRRNWWSTDDVFFSDSVSRLSFFFWSFSSSSIHHWSFSFSFDGLFVCRSVGLCSQWKNPVPRTKPLRLIHFAGWFGQSFRSSWFVRDRPTKNCSKPNSHRARWGGKAQLPSLNHYHFWIFNSFFLQNK